MSRRLFSGSGIRRNLRSPEFRVVDSLAQCEHKHVLPAIAELQPALRQEEFALWTNLPMPSDVTGLGFWGNGDVQVFLSSLNELPYIVGLVRQSLELQLGNVES